MKKLYKSITLSFFVIFLAGFGKTSQAQLILDCESGNRAIEQGNCWVFGAVTYVNTGVINGSWSTRSNSLSNPSPTASWIKTPWMLPGTGNITFQTKLTANNGSTRGVRLFYIPYDPSNAPNYEGTPVEFYDWEWPTLNTNTYTITAPLPAEIENSTDPFRIRVSFVGTGGNSRAIGDDYVFPGTYWSDPANGCVPLSTGITDTDGDGVADEDDDYPTDPFRAYNNFFPAQNAYGTVAFEDNWPSRGDYDFNDVVVNYNINRVTNAQNQVVEVLGSFIMRASGASFRNGFGFQMDGITPNKIIEASGFHVSPESIISYAANGLEANQNFANCIVFDNFYKAMSHPGSGTGINTDKSAPFVPYVTLNVTLKFQENGVPAAGGVVNLTELPATAFNFYIFIKQDRGREVHLADRMPTSLVNTALFGTGDDDTNPGTGKYFKTPNNLPWGIDIIQGFDYPIEKAPISEAYLHFVEWAESSGTAYPDWYSNNPGYRDASKIY